MAAPPYDPVMVWVPYVPAVGVYVTEQVFGFEPPVSVHDAAGVKAPDPDELKLTVPVGPVPPDTEAVHSVAPVPLAGEHVTVVVVAVTTAMLSAPLLPPCVESPL